VCILEYISNADQLRVARISGIVSRHASTVLRRGADKPAAEELAAAIAELRWPRPKVHDDKAVAVAVFTPHWESRTAVRRGERYAPPLVGWRRCPHR
jgi:hypothetical protein